MKASSHQAKASASHIVPARVYAMVSVALIMLTVISIVVSQLDWGGFGTAIVLCAATINAALVAGFFYASTLRQ